MASKTFRIISHYEPEQTATLTDLDDKERIWNTGPTFISPRPNTISYRVAHPPLFVPASKANSSHPPTSEENKIAPEQNRYGTGEWYRSLREGSTLSFDPTTSTNHPSSTPSLALNATRRQIASLSPKKDRFIRRDLESPAPHLHPPDQPSIADILSRAPPPLPSEPRFEPTIRTQIGPTNKGYRILRRSGWREGEGLGAWRIRAVSEREPLLQPSVSQNLALRADYYSATESRNYPEARLPINHLSKLPKPRPAMEQSVQNPPIVQLKLGDHEIIDLTSISDSELSDEDEKLDLLSSYSPTTPSRISEHTGRVLLAPIRTFLKADRSGIGAHSSLPYLPRPLTNTAQAMQTKKEHLQKKREERARLQREKLKGGKRGARAFQHLYWEEERERRELLAYLNS